MASFMSVPLLILRVKTLHRHHAAQQSGASHATCSRRETDHQLRDKHPQKSPGSANGPCEYTNQIQSTTDTLTNPSTSPSAYLAIQLPILPCLFRIYDARDVLVALRYVVILAIDVIILFRVTFYPIINIVIPGYDVKA